MSGQITVFLCKNLPCMHAFYRKTKQNKTHPSSILMVSQAHTCSAVKMHQDLTFCAPVLCSGWVYKIELLSSGGDHFLDNPLLLLSIPSSH